MKKILIIGAGQLGSRHLQALNLVNQPLQIEVIDNNEASLKTAQARFEATIEKNTHEIKYSNKIDVKEAVDIAIIASTSESRRAIIESLLTSTSVNHLVLEKLLFTKRQDYFDISELLASKQMNTWVNCPMRVMPFYGNLSQFNEGPIQYRVSGSQYGLVTNAIHYLDHVAQMTNDNNFSLNLEYLDKEVIASKRAGYYELTGTLIAKYSNGSMAILQCDKEGMAPVQIEIYNNQHRVISREWQQKAWQTNQAADWQWQETQAHIPYQSSLTSEIVNELLATNQCKLPTYQTSMTTHLQLLDPLKAYIKSFGIKSGSDYPFT